MLFGFLRTTVITAIILLPGFQLTAQPKREVTLYTVVVKADRRYKGILEKVNQDQISLTTRNNRYISISRNDLRVLKVKEFPKKKRAVPLLYPEPGPADYDQNGFLKKEYLDAEPSLAQQVAISGAAMLLSSIYHWVYNGFNNLAVFRVKKDSVRYKENMRDMAGYALYNQAVAEDDVLQLKSLKVPGADSVKQH